MDYAKMSGAIIETAMTLLDSDKGLVTLPQSVAILPYCPKTGNRGVAGTDCRGSGSMKYDPNIHRRRSIRLRGYNYSQAGAYFVTICTRNRECLYGEIVDGKMQLNDAGVMIQSVWDELPVRFPHMEFDASVIMPNHFHAIFVLARRGEPCVRPSEDHPCPSREYGESDNNIDKRNRGLKELKKGEHKVRPYGTSPGTVGRIVQAFKSIATHEYITGVKQNGWPPFPGKLWQRNYWEHIVRNESELNPIRGYILNNPAQWKLDRLHPDQPMWDGRGTARRTPREIRESMAAIIP